MVTSAHYVACPASVMRLTEHAMGKTIIYTVLPSGKNETQHLKKKATRAPCESRRTEKGLQLCSWIQVDVALQQGVGVYMPMTGPSSQEPLQQLPESFFSPIRLSLYSHSPQMPLYRWVYFKV